MVRYNNPREITENREEIIRRIFEFFNEKLNTEFTRGSSTITLKQILIDYFNSNIFETFDEG